MHLDHPSDTALADRARTCLSADPSVDSIANALRTADDLIAFAVGAIGRVARDGGMERATGLTTEATLRLTARRTRWDAVELTAAVDALRAMPRTSVAVAESLLSWSQLRAIVRAVRPLPASARATVDALIADLSPRFADAEPEAIVWAVEDKVASLRADLELQREDRAVEANFLTLQQRFGGGGALYGEADAESFATIAQALESSAGPLATGSADDPDAPSPAAQRMDALVSLCEASLSGAPGSTRPRPRILAVVDAAEAGGARVLPPVAGRPSRVTPLATDVLLCDADVVPVLFDGARPIGVGDTRRTVPAKIRTALVARDGGCRFPGCGAPVSWCDVHHIVSPRKGGDAEPSNLLLLCRRCHRRVHRFGWRMTPGPDGLIEFRHRGRAYTSVSRLRLPARE